MAYSVLFALFFLTIFTSQAAPHQTTSLSSATHAASSSSIPLVLINLLVQNRSSPQTINQNLKLLPMDEGDEPGKVKYCRAGGQNDSREFFLEENFHPGMDILFPVSAMSAITFAAHAAEKPDISTKELPDILDEFGVNPNSTQAESLNDTLTICKSAPLRTERKLCVTSLEGMVKFVVSILGHHVRLYSSQIQDSSILELKVQSKEFVASNVVACHKLVYPYSLYLCHSFSRTKTYRVPLMGGLWGSKATQIVTCHEDTSDWNPKHIAFQILGVKPGNKTICHTNTIYSLVWGGISI
ncbi:hypothetical protein SLEP1_g7079 [Rubroshorea leprosula]|uniref:BURP domain-containing protein n=1 Tax=Rubroshorea leprosula TaxID=152421 RepID=A0AAV5HX85_9ROSI|nr:hypothetical protein SLEP1_g7079 [Rubroshorea leprosula]